MKQINSFLCIPFGIFFDERMFLQFLFRALFVVLRAVEVHFGLILLRVWGLILSRILQIYSIIVRFYMITFFGMKFQIFSSIESCDVSSFMSHAFVAEIIWEHFQDWVQNLKNVRIYFFRATLNTIKSLTIVHQKISQLHTLKQVTPFDLLRRQMWKIT